IDHKAQRKLTMLSPNDKSHRALNDKEKKDYNVTFDLANVNAMIGYIGMRMC
ncbi:13417_t:CDS:2, partial [Acaulospora morrowiae]